MKKYFIEIDGQKTEVTKEICDVVMGNAGQSRHERYVIDELAPRHELSLEKLNESDYPIEYHMVTEIQSAEDQVLKIIELSLLRKAIKELEREERLIINAIYYRGISERQLEKIIKIPRSTIGYRKRRIIEKLKKIINFYENL